MQGVYAIICLPAAPGGGSGDGGLGKGRSSGGGAGNGKVGTKKRIGGAKVVVCLISLLPAPLYPFSHYSTTTTTNLPFPYSFSLYFISTHFIISGETKQY